MTFHYVVFSKLKLAEDYFCS